jgi:hypothetical protein
MLNLYMRQNGFYEQKKNVSIKMCNFYPICKLGSKCRFLHPKGPCNYGIKCLNKHCNLDHDISKTIYNTKKNFPEEYFDQIFQCEGRIDMMHTNIYCGFSLDEVHQFIYSDAFKLACRDFVEPNLWSFAVFTKKLM